MNSSWDNSQTERHRQLSVLWQQLGALSEAQWSEMYRLVVLILRHSNRQKLPETGHEFDELISLYFFEKIFSRAQVDPEKLKSQMPLHHGALINFFQRFVISLSRSAQSQALNRSQSWDDEEGRINAAVEVAGQEPTIVDTLLAQGFSAEKACDQARRFVEALSNLERLLIRNYAGDNLSISRLVNPTQLAAAQLAVTQLGLWQSKTRKRDLSEFAKTDLGCFMTRTIGEPLNETHSGSIEVLMRLICKLA